MLNRQETYRLPGTACRMIRSSEVSTRIKTLSWFETMLNTQQQHGRNRHAH
jgi:hypothetical protein